MKPLHHLEWTWVAEPGMFFFFREGGGYKLEGAAPQTLDNRGGGGGGVCMDARPFAVHPFLHKNKQQRHATLGFF